MKNSNSFGLFVLIVSLIIFPVSAQQLDQQSSGDSKFYELDIPRRLMAIDNVTAWPNLTVLRDGTIIASIFNQPSHGHVEGDVECWASEDGGLSWNYRGTPTQHEPYTVRMNHAAGVNSKGDLVVLCSGWDNIRPRRNPDSRRPEATISISKDGGKSWERGGRMPPPIKGISHHVPFGDIQLAANGDLVVGTYVARVIPPPEDKPQEKRELIGRVYAVRSSDDGKTWNHVTQIAENIHVEAAMLHMGDGVWLAASRTRPDRGLDLHRSTDDGFTWSHVENSGIRIPRVSAAHLLKLNDGRILLSYGNRSPGNAGIDVRISEDGGQSWAAPQRILNLPEKAGDYGYPAAVEFPNGRIMIAYYTDSTFQHDRYHMGVVNFHIDELVVRLPE